VRLPLPVVQLDASLQSPVAPEFVQVKDRWALTVTYAPKADSSQEC
jgi:hypothetical protein